MPEGETMLLKNKDGEIRLIWRLLLLVVPFLLAAYMLRYVPIRISAGILMKRGFSAAAARSQAMYLFLEDPVGVSIVGIIQGLLWFVIVCVLLRTTEKRSCDLKGFGLAFNRKSLLLVPLGFILALVLCFVYYSIDYLFNKTPFVWSHAELGVLPLILVTLDMLANGFGEEAAFRAYWQRLLIDRHGLWVGILLASATFVLLHLLVARYTLVALLAGVLLACSFGILYVWTGSIFLVGMLHATFNLTPRMLGQWPSDTSLLIVNGLTLIMTILLYQRSLKVARVST
jgi:membrane protease YdiL (CAAX protease family)